MSVAHCQRWACRRRLRCGSLLAEEVYACEFLGAGSGGGEHLCTASADSLFLWDLQSGSLLQRCAGAVAGKRDTAGTFVAQQLSVVRLQGLRFEHGVAMANTLAVQRRQMHHHNPRSHSGAEALFKRHWLTLTRMAA